MGVDLIKMATAIIMIPASAANQVIAMIKLRTPRRMAVMWHHRRRAETVQQMMPQTETLLIRCTVGYWKWRVNRQQRLLLAPRTSTANVMVKRRRPHRPSIIIHPNLQIPSITSDHHHQRITSQRTKTIIMGIQGKAAAAVATSLAAATVSRAH